SRTGNITGGVSFNRGYVEKVQPSTQSAYRAQNGMNGTIGINGSHSQSSNSAVSGKPGDSPTSQYFAGVNIPAKRPHSELSDSVYGNEFPNDIIAPMGSSGASRITRTNLSFDDKATGTPTRVDDMAKSGATQERTPRSARFFARIKHIRSVLRPTVSSVAKISELPTRNSYSKPMNVEDESEEDSSDSSHSAREADGVVEKKKGV